MPAAVYKAAGEVAVEQVPVPEVGADDVLVAVELCGICGSDLHMVLEGWGVPGSWHGHEWIGTGRGGRRRRDAGGQPGDTVVGGPGLRCGECRMCKANRPSLCEASGTPGIGLEHGAFATYKVAPAAQVLPMPDGLDPRAAALAEPLSVALHGIHQGGTEPGDRVLVLGAGPIGALSIAALRAMGVDDVRCVEPAPSRQELAAAVGATRVLHPDELDVPNMAEPMRIVDDAVDVVLECSGKAKAMEAGLAQLVKAGTLVLVGAGIDRPAVRPEPHPAQRARDHRRQHLRPRRLRAGARAARLRQAPDRAPRGARGGAARRRPRRHARPGRGPHRRKGAGAAMTGPAFTKPPRLNHVAMSVPADSLDAEGRAALCAFYGDVFGFEEYEDLTEDRHRLVFRAHHHEQFMFLISEDEPMRAPRLDHFGMSVASLDDFQEVHRRAAAWKDKEPERRRPHRAPGRGVRRDAQPPQLLRALPPPPHGGDPALRVLALEGSTLQRRRSELGTAA